MHNALQTQELCVCADAACETANISSEEKEQQLLGEAANNVFV